MKVLYNSKTDDLDAMLPQIRANVLLPDGMRFLVLQETWGDPAKAVGTRYEGAVHKHDLRLDHQPGLWPEQLFQPAAYDWRQPCTTVKLYCSEGDIQADTEHAYGHAHTIIRFVPTKKRNALWKYFGKDDRESWDELMKRTTPVPKAMPAILSIPRVPCRGR